MKRTTTRRVSLVLSIALLAVAAGLNIAFGDGALNSIAASLCFFLLGGDVYMLLVGERQTQ